jgi:hypothetical protein
MAKRTWILLDVEEDQYVDDVRLTSADADGVPEGISIVKRRLRGGLRDGVDVVEVDNGALRFVVVPTRGMGIHRASLGNMQLGWQSPVKGPVHPSLVNLAQADGLGWLTGFDELVARCGLVNNGAPVFNPNGSLRWGLHGRIQNTPANKVRVAIDDASGEITVTGSVDEGCLYGQKYRLTTAYMTLPGEPGVRVIDMVTNVGGEPTQMQLLYHINLGVPLVDPGSKCVAPVAKIAPRAAGEWETIATWDTYHPETPGAGGVCFFMKLLPDAKGWTRALLHNAAATQGVTVKYNATQLPCFTLWKNAQTAADGYVTGLEPATNYPNERTFEESKGRVIGLAPGESRAFEWTLEAHPDAKSVAAAKQAIAKLQAAQKPEVLTAPDPDWSVV